MLIQANSGGGKSWALRYLLEQTNGKIQQFVFDPEGEFASLREHIRQVLVGRDGDLAADPATAAALCEQLMELQASAIFDLYDLRLRERRRFVRLFLETLMALPRDRWHPVLVVIDEAHIFAPERGAGESEATDVVENWNATNDFILYGKGREFGTNKHEDMEVTMLCLHLLQLSMVYINTLLIQEVLSEPEWKAQMTPNDLRALTPLIYNHVNPYGVFVLDMNQRLSLKSAVSTV